MAQVPSNIGDGGTHLNGEETGSLKSLLNGLATFMASLRGAAPSAVTSPLGTAVPAITSPLGTAVPALTASSNLSAYVDAAAPTGSENSADRTQMNAMRADLVEMRGYVVALVAENTQMRSYMTASRTEITALRATQTTRAGLTPSVTPSDA